MVGSFQKKFQIINAVVIPCVYGMHLPKSKRGNKKTSTEVKVFKIWGKRLPESGGFCCRASDMRNDTPAERG